MRGPRALLVIVLVGVLAACTSDGGPEAPASATPSVRTGAGGVLRVGLVVDEFAVSNWCTMLFCGHTYDPQSTSFVDAFELDRCCFMRTLLSYDGSSVGAGGTVLRPDMAVALPDISPDGLTRAASAPHTNPPPTATSTGCAPAGSCTAPAWVPPRSSRMTCSASAWATQTAP